MVNPREDAKKVQGEREEQEGWITVRLKPEYE